MAVLLNLKPPLNFNTFFKQFIVAGSSSYTFLKREKQIAG